MVGGLWAGSGVWRCGLMVHPYSTAAAWRSGYKVQLSRWTDCVTGFCGNTLISSLHGKLEVLSKEVSHSAGCCHLQHIPTVVLEVITASPA